MALPARATSCYGGASAPGTNGVFELSALDGTNGFRLNGVDANDFSGPLRLLCG